MGTNGFDCIQIPGAMNVMVDMDSIDFQSRSGIIYNVCHVLLFPFRMRSRLPCLSNNVDGELS